MKIQAMAVQCRAFNRREKIPLQNQNQDGHVAEVLVAVGAAPARRDVVARVAVVWHEIAEH